MVEPEIGLEAMESLNRDQMQHQKGIQSVKGTDRELWDDTHGDYVWKVKFPEGPDGDLSRVPAWGWKSLPRAQQGQAGRKAPRGSRWPSPNAGRPE